MDEHGLPWMDMDSHGWIWNKQMEMKGYGRTRMVMDINGWTWKVMERQMNDIAWHEREYIVTERLKMAWKSV